MNDCSLKEFSIRQADWQDAISIQRLINTHSLVYRYLDWRDPLQWLGPQPYLLLEKEHKLYATLACPTDPANIAWVRLFACSWEINLNQAWKILISEALQQLTTNESNPHCYILALEDWIDLLLQQNQYPVHQELVILHKYLTTDLASGESNNLTIRKMVMDDLPEVEQIDAASFEDIWVYSLPTLELAFQQSCLAYIVEAHGKPVGYLLGTANGAQAHLARIAVIRENTRHHIATHLITNFFHDLSTLGIRQVTLNTQSDNKASLALYDKMGFRRTGETFAVYQIL